MLTIEELARQADTATSTVRMYQSKGLLPAPQRRGRVGYYGQGHLARLRLIAQLQGEGFSLASIKRLTDAWENGRSLDDVLGLEAQVAATWGSEEPVRLGPERYEELFPGQEITPENFQRAIALDLVTIEDGAIVVKSPRLLEIGSELARSGMPVDDTLDELEALQTFTAAIAERFTRVFERHVWIPFVEAGLPADEVRQLTESLQRLNTLAEGVVDVTLRDALRRKAGEFLIEQASLLEEAGALDGLRPLARAAGFEM
jgi:DNA-binding transcriptional MerR regulator